jgi:hypothetical protein
MLPFDIEKYYDVVRSPRDHYEIGSIPYRKEWHRDGSSSFAVNIIEYSVIGACERKGKAQ